MRQSALQLLLESFLTQAVQNIVLGSRAVRRGIRRALQTQLRAARLRGHGLVEVVVYWAIRARQRRVFLED